MILTASGLGSLLALLSALGLAAGRWYWLKKPRYRLQLLTVIVKYEIKKGPSAKVKRRIQKQIYQLLNQAIVARDTALVYETLDLAKLAFGYITTTDDDCRRLLNFALAALKNKQTDVAGFILDAVRPLTKRLDMAGIILILEKLSLVGILAGREKQPYIITKAAEQMFMLLAVYSENITDVAVRQAFFVAFSHFGLLALRRHDEALFREICRYLDQAEPDFYVALATGINVNNILTTWLNRIVKNDERQMFTEVRELIWRLISNGKLADQLIRGLLAELSVMAGQAVLNPHNGMPARLTNLMFDIAARNSRADEWRFAVGKVGAMARLAVQRHELEKAFPMVFPLFDRGRGLLVAELRFGEYNPEFRRRALFEVLRECLFLVTFIARQSTIGLPGETINDIYQCWVRQVPGRTRLKSAKKFFQLLLLYWLKVRRRQSKRWDGSNGELDGMILFSDIELKLLGL